MRIAVTGGAGLTGSALLPLLLASGHQVRAFVRRASAELPVGCERHLADCDDAERVAHGLAGCDALIHLAGIRLGAPMSEALARRPVARVVAVSSAGVYSPHNAAAGAYLSGEHAFRSAPGRLTIVRPTMIYGTDRDKNLHLVLRSVRRFRFLPLIGDGRALMQPIYYQDLAAALAALLHLEIAQVDVGGACALSIRDVGLTVFEALRLTPRFLRIPYPAARGAAGVVERIVGRRLVERVDRMMEDRVVDNTLLLSLTHVRPRDFRSGVFAQVGRA